MPSAFVISTPRFTAGILSSHGPGLRFEASDAKTSLLHNRIFASPEDAQRAVERLIAANKTDRPGGIDVSCRVLF